MPQADACLEAEGWPHTWTAGCEACRAWRAHLHRGQQHAHTCTALSDKSIGKKCSSMDVPHQSTLSPPPPLSAKGWKNPTDPCEAFVEVIMLPYWGYNVAISQEPLPAGVQATPDAAKSAPEALLRRREGLRQRQSSQQRPAWSMHCYQAHILHAIGLHMHLGK